METNEAGEKLAQLSQNMYNNKDRKFTWEDFKKKVLHLAGSLVMEENTSGQWSMSTGKVSWWIAFLPAIYVWIFTEAEVKENHLTILLTLAGYNMGKKLMSSASGLLANRRSNSNNSGANLGPG